MNKSAVLCVVFGLFLACPDPSLAVPTILLSESFNFENGGTDVLDYSGFANWTVCGRAVDLVGNGFFDVLPGNGLYIDLDASTPSAGRIASFPIFAKSGEYTLSFDLAGLHWNSHESGQEPLDHVAVKVGAGSLLSKSYSLPAGDPFVTFAEAFAVDAATSALMSFEGVGGDNLGVLLDDVNLQYIHTPSSGAVLLAGLGAGLIGWLQLVKRL